MKKKLLVLTDHATHSEENSIYRLLQEMLRHPACGQIDVASRGIGDNRLFFQKMTGGLYGTRVHATFAFHEDGRDFKKRLARLNLRSYDYVLMRLPYPVPGGFWKFVETTFPHARFVNRPLGIEQTGSKAFLLHFPEVCAPMVRCRTVEQIDAFRQKFPIVLKPVRSYGGKGLVKVEGDLVSFSEIRPELASGAKKMNWEKFAEEMSKRPFDFLGVKFLQNVGLGDKRVLVCNGRIIGASLRKPAPGGWLCNVSQGGSSHSAAADADEQAIVEKIDPVLRQHGVVFYGMDTLVGDDGKRVLSEINTASIGGLKAVEEYTRLPKVREVADLVWGWFLEQK